MSTEVDNYMTKNYLVQEYNAEWQVDKLSSLGTKSIRTPIFSPVPIVNIGFCFELWYQVIKISKKEHASYFKLVLLKFGVSDATTPLKLKIRVTVNYSDGTVYQHFASPASISAENVNAVTCADVTTEFFSHRYEETSHKRRMASDKFIIKFRTKFYGHLCSPATYYQKMHHLDSLQSFVHDFKSLQQSMAFSDVVIQVGRTKFPVHKSVLAAHSPVFLKMLEHDFLESKTDTVTITDCNSETFEDFLMYLYSGEIEKKMWPFIKDLYTLSDKYAVQTLKQDCTDIIASSINLEQVCDILELAYFYNDNKIKDEAMNFAAMHFKELVSTDRWAELVSNDPLIGYEILRFKTDAFKNPEK